jgi:hypothetical protein
MSDRFAPLQPLAFADIASYADDRNEWMSLAEGSLHASRRKSDAGRGKTGMNLPVRESHANRNKTVYDFASSDDGVTDGME